MEFLLLGTLEVRDRVGEPVVVGRRQERLLLGLLLLEVGRTVPTDRLVRLLWPERPVQDPRATLRTYVSRLRSRIAASSDGAAPRLSVRPGGLLAETDPELVDAHRFARQVHLARAEADAVRRAELLGPALALWRGPLLADVASDGLRELVGAELTEQRLAATWMYADAELARGRHHEVLGALAAAVAAYPLHEPLVGRFMLALHRTGRDADALTAYQNLRARMAEALGADPSPQLRDRYLAILRQDPALDPPEASDHPVHGVPEKIATGGYRAAGPDAPAQLPAAMSGFVGREAQLVRLDAILAAFGKQPTSMAITVLSGTAGVGKTTLAVHWAHLVRDRFPDGQLYVDLRGFDTAEPAVSAIDAMHRFFDALAVPPGQVPADAQAQAALYRSLLAGRRILVVLDNARDVEQVRPLLPGSATCLVLVTSRNQLIGLVAAAGAHSIAVDPLSAAESRALFRCRLGAIRVAAETPAVDALVTMCAQLPLALAVVAARAAVHPGLPLEALAAELHASRGSLDGFDTGDPATNVRHVISLSYQALEAEAARLFRLLGLHPGPDIGLAAAASLAGVPVPSARTQLTVLERASLVTEHRPGRYVVHDLLRIYAAELAAGPDPDAERWPALRRMFGYYLRSADVADRVAYPHRDRITLARADPLIVHESFASVDQALAWLAAEHSVLLAVIIRAVNTRFDTHAWQLAWTLMNFFDRRGHWNDWAATHMVALAAATRLKDLAAQAHILRGLGRADVWLGRHDAARRHLEDALELFDQLGDREGQARTQLALGWAAGECGRDRAALEYLYQALDTYRSVGHRPGQSSALNMIGWTHDKLGDFEQALANCQRALVLQHDLGDRRGQAHTLDSLGLIHRHLGHHAEAVACYEQAPNTFRARGEPYHEAGTLARLGDAHHAAGHPGLARDAWHHALQILEELGHPDADPIRIRLATTAG
ncbi:AfsR/SARP family transcriptional regulator [Actinoplanes sp. NPDC051513]|uniref:AfsR/SARP family transcriptional regulator n=1 Tax=Actinoplanes sp. NPDC051513 TaxID=3363908 RepID=UPI0037A6A954